MLRAIADFLDSLIYQKKTVITRRIILRIHHTPQEEPKPAPYKKVTKIMNGDAQLEDVIRIPGHAPLLIPAVVRTMPKLNKQPGATNIFRPQSDFAPVLIRVRHSSGEAFFVDAHKLSRSARVRKLSKKQVAHMLDQRIIENANAGSHTVSEAIADGTLHLNLSKESLFLFFKVDDGIDLELHFKNVGQFTRSGDVRTAYILARNILMSLHACFVDITTIDEDELAKTIIALLLQV